MVVFGKVVAELSADLLALIPDPLLAGDDLSEYSSNECQYEACEQQFTDVTSKHSSVKNVLCESRISAGNLLSYAELDCITLLEELSCVQRKGSYLYDKMKRLFPSIELMWSKFEVFEVLKVHGSWESMLNVHRWLENFIISLVSGDETKDFDNNDFSDVKKNSVNNNGRIVVSRGLSGKENYDSPESCWNKACAGDVSYEKDESAVGNNEFVTFGSCVKEELNVSGSNNDETIFSLDDSLMPSNCTTDSKIFYCHCCSFEATSLNVFKIHAGNCHQNTNVSKLQYAQMNSKQTMKKGANLKKRTDGRRKRGRPPKSRDALAGNSESINNYDDFFESHMSGVEESNLEVENELKKFSDSENEASTIKKSLPQSSTDLVNVEDPLKFLHKSLEEQSQNGEDPDLSKDGGVAPVFGCSLCEFLTSKQRNLVFHRIRVHGERNLSCPICSKQFAIRKDLNQHLRFHTERFCCEQCGKTLRSKYALNLHISVVHEKVQPKPIRSYLCNLCGRLCRSKTDYTVHCNKEHLGVHPHSCKVCGMRFFAKANLKVHMQTHRESRDFICNECGKTFRQRQGLRVHLNIHKTERPYQCSVCEKTFTQRGALVRHERTHTAERPYACKLCKSAFNDYSILRRHMLGIHKIEDTAVLRKTVKEACAEARDNERNRLTGSQCKAESSGFDTANTLIALSQQYQGRSLDSVPLTSELSSVPKDRDSFESCTLVQTLHSDTFPILSLSEVAFDNGQNLASSSSVICLTASNVVATSMEQTANSSGSFSFQPVVADVVRYISLPYDHGSVTDFAQHSDSHQ